MTHLILKFINWGPIFHRDEVITKLEEVILKLVQDISQDKPPSLKYNCRNSWKNTRLENSTWYITPQVEIHAIREKP